MELEAQIEVFKSLTDEKMGELINDSLRSIETAVTELVTQHQIHRKGQMPDGSKIRPLDRTYPVYSSMYEAYKSQLGLYQGHVDLSLTGEFLKSFHIKYHPDGFEILAGDVRRDGKDLTSELRWRYGDFEGLTEDSMDRLRAMLLPVLIQKLRNYVSI